MPFDLKRRLAVEGLGTGILVATVVGSGIMAAKLAGGNMAVALLGNTIPTGAILFVLITIFGPISGAHFNPAVSLVMALRRELSLRDAGLFTVAQIIGGCLGTLVAHAMFALPLLQFSTTGRTGGAQLFAEFVAAFGLLLTILAAVRFKPDALATAVGLYITAAYWFAASTSFANPAVTIARALTDTFAGIDPAHVIGFIIAQLLGASEVASYAVPEKIFGLVTMALGMVLAPCIQTPTATRVTSTPTTGVGPIRGGKMTAARDSTPSSTRPKAPTRLRWLVNGSTDSTSADGTNGCGEILCRLTSSACRKNSARIRPGRMTACAVYSRSSSGTRSDS